MDALHLSIALGPLAIYFLVLGLINLTPRPFLTTGARDWAALGLAISGFVVAGPMELFFPEGAASRFGWFVWVLLLGLYALAVLLVCLLSRPRLTIYNISGEELHHLLQAEMATIDTKGHWVGNGLVLPSLGVQAHFEPFLALRNVQIVASGPRQDRAGWRTFELRLACGLRSLHVSPNFYGVTQLLFSGLIFLTISFWFFNSQQEVAQSLGEMLRW